MAANKSLLDKLPVLNNNKGRKVEPAKEQVPSLDDLASSLPVMDNTSGGQVVAPADNAPAEVAKDAQSPALSMQTTQGIPPVAANISMDYFNNQYKKFLGVPAVESKTQDGLVMGESVGAFGQIPTVKQPGTAPLPTDYQIKSAPQQPVVVQGLSEQERAAAQKSAIDEVAAAKNFLVSDFLQNKEALGSYAFRPANGEMSLGTPDVVKSEDFAKRLVDPKGDTQALQDYMTARNKTLESSYERQMQDLDSRYNITPNPGNGSLLQLKPSSPANVDYAGYEREKKAINDNYKSTQEHLNSAAFALASIKAINKEVSTGVKLQDLSAAEIGMKVRSMLGGDTEVQRQQRYIRQGYGLTPQEKVDNEQIGYRAMQYAQMNAFAGNDDFTSKQLSDKVENYPNKILKNNPDFVKQQVSSALSDEIYKNKNAITSVFLGSSISQEDIDAAGRKLGLNPSLYSNITPDDISNPKNVLKKTVSSFIENTAVPMYKAGMRGLAYTTDKGITPFLGDLLLPADVRDGEGVDYNRFNHKFDENWYDNGWMGEYLKGKTPGAGQLFTPGSKVETDESSPAFLTDVSREQAGKFSFDPRAILGQVGEGAGQILAFGYTGGKLGRLAESANLVKTAEAADRVGITLSTFVTQYEPNYEAALRNIGDAPEDEGKRNLYALMRTTSSALTEQILPDTKIVRNLFGEGTSAGRELIDFIQKNGVSAMTAPTMKGFMVKAIGNGFKDWQKEISEDVLDQLGQEATDAILAPKTYEQTDTWDDLKQTYITSAISSFIPTFGGGINRTRNESNMRRATLYMVGQDPIKYSSEITRQAEAGEITKEQANDKIKLVNTMAQIVRHSVPVQSIVTGAPLTAENKIDYANNLLQEAIAEHQKSEVKDPVQIQHIDAYIESLRADRNKQLTDAGLGSRKAPGETNAEAVRRFQREQELGQQRTQASQDQGPIINSPFNTINNGISTDQEASASQENGQGQQEATGAQGDQRQGQDVLGTPPAEESSAGASTPGATSYVFEDVNAEEPPATPLDRKMEIERGRTYELSLAPNPDIALERRRIEDVNAKYDAELESLNPIKNAAPQGPAEEKVNPVSAEPHATQADVIPGQVGENIKKRWEDAPKIDGNTRTRTLADGSEISGRYVLTTSDAPTPSHDPSSFGTSQGFPLLENGTNPNDRDYSLKENIERVTQKSLDYNGRALEDVPTVDKNGVVVDGNDRTMSGQIAARQNTDAKYISALKKNAANYGFTEKQVDDMIKEGKSPRVLFVADEEMPYTTQTFSRFNPRDAVKAKTAYEEARELGRNVDDHVVARIGEVMSQHDTLSDFYGSPNDTGIVKDMLMQAGVINTDGLPKYYNVNTRTFTDEGKRILQNLLLGKVMDEEALSLLNKYPGIREKVVLSMRNLMSIESRPEYSIKEFLSEALKLYDAVRRQGVSDSNAALSKFLSEGVLFGEPVSLQALALWHVLDAGAKKSLNKFTSSYASQIENYHPGTGQDLFNEVPPSKEALILSLNEDFKKYENVVAQRNTEQGAIAGEADQRSADALGFDAVAAASIEEDNADNTQSAVIQEEDVRAEDVDMPLVQEEAPTDIVLPYVEEVPLSREDTQQGIVTDTPADTRQAPVEVVDEGKATPKKEAVKLPPASRPIPTGNAIDDAVNLYNWLNGIVNKKEAKIAQMENRLQKMVESPLDSTQADRDELRNQLEREDAALKQFSEKLKDAEKLANKLLAAEAKKADAKAKKANEAKKSLGDAVRKAKIKSPANTLLTTPAQIPVVLWNSAVEIVAMSLEAGKFIAEAVQDGVDHINRNWKTRWNQQAFEDMMGRNISPTPSSAEIRSRIESELPISSVNKASADKMLQDISANKLSLKDALTIVDSTPNISAAVKNQIAQYLRRYANQAIFKTSGEELAKNALANNSNGYSAAIAQLLNDEIVDLGSAVTQSERENIRMKYAAAISLLDSQETKDEVAGGSIIPNYTRTANTSQFQLPERQRRHVAQEMFQDRYARLETAQSGSIDPVTGNTDAVSARRTAKSKAAYTIDKLRKDIGHSEYVKGSFVDRLTKAGIDVRRFGLFLYANHAQERNLYNKNLRERLVDKKLYDLRQEIADAMNEYYKQSGQIAFNNNTPPDLVNKIAQLEAQIEDIKQQRNNKFTLLPDGGSGMTNQQAQDILDEIRSEGKLAEYEKFADEFRDKVTGKILDFKYDNDIIDETTYNKLKTFYSKYVPLKMSDDEYEESGGKKGQKTLSYAQSGVTGKDIMKSYGSIDHKFDRRNNPFTQALQDFENAIGDSEENKANRRLANLIRINPNEEVWDIKPALYDKTYDKNGDLLKSVPHPTPPNTIAFYENGKKQLILLHDEGLQSMVKKVGTNWFIENIATPFSRIITTFSTLISPEFMIKNPFVDIFDGINNLQVQGKDIEKKFRSFVRPDRLFKTVAALMRNNGNEWQQWAEEWRKNGGEITFLSQLDNDKNKAKMDKMFQNYGKTFSQANMRHITHNLRNFATVLEQMTRIMAYRASIEGSGGSLTTAGRISAEQAAVISRNATVDFEKKGVYGAYINAFKAFGNAGIQGLTNLGYGFLKSKRFRMFIGGTVIAGILEAMVADWVGDCDDPAKSDDCYWEKSEYEKQHSFIIPTNIMGHGSGYLDIPNGRQFGWFNYLGKTMYGVMTGHVDPAKALSRIAGSLVDFYNPTGGAPLPQQMAGNAGFIPGLYTNKTTFDAPIVPENDTKMPYENYFPNTPEAYIKAAEVLHNVTGGDAGHKGAVDISPDHLQYMMRTVFSGLYGFLERGAKLTDLATGGEGELKTKDIPIARIFRQESSMAYTQERYFDIANKSKDEVLSPEEVDEARKCVDDLYEGGIIDAQTRAHRIETIVNNQQRERTDAAKRAYQDKQKDSGE